MTAPARRIQAVYAEVACWAAASAAAREELHRQCIRSRTGASRYAGKMAVPVPGPDPARQSGWELPA